MSTTEAPLRILCLNYEYPPVGGGGGRVAARLNAELARRGHSVRVQTAGLRHLAGTQMIEGVEVFRAQSFRSKEDTCTVPEMGLYILTSLLPALRHCREWKPHVIHAHFAVPTGALAWLVHRITGVPYVLTAHLGDVPGGVPEQTAGLFRIIQPFTRPIWNNAAELTAVSTHVALLAQNAYGRRPKVILNGIAIGDPPDIRLNTPPRILFVGRLSVQKNPLLAIEALALIRDLRWTLEVVGDGPLRADMEDEATGAGIAGRIEFRGWRNASEVEAFMKDADILLMTSLNEGMPVTAIEALKFGLAIVASDIGGMRDVVEPGVNGSLVALDAAVFADKLSVLLSNPELLLRQRKAGRDLVARFDLQHSVDEYEDVLYRAASPRA